MRHADALLETAPERRDTACVGEDPDMPSPGGISGVAFFSCSLSYQPAAGGHIKKSNKPSGIATNGRFAARPFKKVKNKTAWCVREYDCPSITPGAWTLSHPSLRGGLTANKANQEMSSCRSAGRAGPESGLFDPFPCGLGLHQGDLVNPRLNSFSLPPSQPLSRFPSCGRARETDGGVSFLWYDHVAVLPRASCLHTDVCY